MVHKVDAATGRHRLDIAVGTSVHQVIRLFWLYMLRSHNFLAGTPALICLTLPTVLTDADYQCFLLAIGDFFAAYREPLALLAAETAAGLPSTDEERQIRGARTVAFSLANDWQSAAEISAACKGRFKLLG